MAKPPSDRKRKTAVARRGKNGGNTDGKRVIRPGAKVARRRKGASTSSIGPEAGEAMKPREARGAARRDAILAAALDEFSARGYEGARLDDVATRAGVAKGTIYLYFRDKETLFQELVRAMLAPLIVAIEAMGAVDVPVPVMAERFVDLFVREIFQTRRQDVVRLMISEGRRFPELAEFYYREVLSRIIGSVRGVLKRANKNGDVPAALIEFPQLIAAPGLIAIVWSGLFDRFEPLDVRKMMTAHVKLLFASRSPHEND
jgi:AcrR family transcriptional regulator